MNGRKIAYLDGLRGLAALAVVLAHYFQVFVPAMFENRMDISHFAFDRVVPKTPLNVLYNGNFAVCLFFVLSGYVLSCRFFRDHDRGLIAGSLIRRYFRLAVPAFVSVLLAYTVMALGLNTYGEIQALTLSPMPDPYAVMPGFGEMVWQTLFHTFFTYGMAYNPVLWTMTYELLGSFMVFAVLLLLGTSPIRFVVYAAGIWFFRDSYYLGFWFGMLLSDLTNSSTASKVRIPSRAAVGLLTLSGLYLGSYPYVSPTGFFYQWLPLGGGFPNAIAYRTLGALLVIVSLLNSCSSQRWLESRPAVYLGRLSFSLYLVHFAVLCSLSGYLFKLFSGSFSYGWSFVLTTVLSLPFIFVLAHLLYVGVDSRIVKLLSRVHVPGHRRRAGRHAVSVPANQTKNM
ncbi:acyltransferase family protein [Paenibacillus sepulcri]|uniref:Acyltransferase n=1 Tax=Paenibacillus sepulcri TaxID=359917 RepID=A0ABS7CCR4_9BACL|nr:acyltransferase [Paenibacillus sepulcri]